MQVAMIAAGFSADDADQLRRSMAAWSSRGSMEPFRDRLLEGMKLNGYDPGFAESLFQQLKGFGEYGFPESHSASFAKLAWFSAWFKRHEPAAFLTALLNSQPMGFYSPSQLVQDARRHGVRVLPVDVLLSSWETRLETQPDTSTAVRLGMNRIKGLSETSAQRIIHARDEKVFTSVDDLSLRARLPKRDVSILAAANALEQLVRERRQALWQATRPQSKDLLRYATAHVDAPVLAPMPEVQEIETDYALTGLTLGRHPLALLRPELCKLNFENAETLTKHYPDRRLARACGLVTTRQRPQTSRGTIFVTLEDETGHVNVIVNRTLADKQRLELTQSGFLGVYGVWQRQENTCHLLARRLVSLDHLLGRLKTRSRDFH